MKFKKTFWQFQNKKGSTTTADHLDDYSVKRLAVIKVLGEKKFKELTDSEVKKLIQQVKILQVVGVEKTTDSGSRVFDRLFKVLDNAKQYKISCLGTGIFKPFSKNVVVKMERGTDAIFEAIKLIVRELVKNGIKDFRGDKNGLISGDGKSKMEFKNLDNPRKTPSRSVVFKSPLNHTKSGLIVSPIKAETKADAIYLFYKGNPHLKGKGEIVSVTQGTPPSVKRTDLVQKRPKIGDSEKQFIPPLTKFKEILKSATGDNKKIKWKINSNTTGYFTVRGDKISFIAKSNDNPGTGWAVGKAAELEKIYTRFKTQILPYN